MISLTTSLSPEAPVLPQIDSTTSSFEQLVFSDFGLDSNNGNSNIMPNHVRGDMPALQGSHSLQKPFQMESQLDTNQEHGMDTKVPVPGESMQGFYDISPSLNTTDMMSLNYLIQSSITGSEGFRILSETEWQALKSRQVLLNTRKNDLENRLSLEMKMKEAATSISKFHLNPREAHSSSSKRSSLFTAKKKTSRQAMEEADISSRRIEQIKVELEEVERDSHECEVKVLHHSVGVLALTHLGSRSSVSLAYSAALGYNPNIVSSPMLGLAQKHEQSPSSIQGRNLAMDFNSMPKSSHQATARMSRLSRSSFSSSSVKSIMKPRESSVDRDCLDSLISTVSHALSSPTTSPGPAPPTTNKLRYLNDLTQRLVRQYNTTNTVLKEKEDQMTELAGRVRQVVLDLGGNAFLDPTTYGSNTETLQSPSSTLQYANALVKAVNAVQAKMEYDKNEMQMKIENLTRGAAEKGNITSNTQHEQHVLHLQQQLRSFQETYEDNRTALEKLELENLDLQNELKDVKWHSQGELERLGLEVITNKERVDEWKEQANTTRDELQAVIQTLEEATRQVVEYEAEKTSMEALINKLQDQLFQASNDSVDKRMAMATEPRVSKRKKSKGDTELGGVEDSKEHSPKTKISSPSSSYSSMSSSTSLVPSISPSSSSLSLSSSPPSPSPPVSVSILQQEFRRILHDVNSKHSSELQKEQNETKKIERLLRSYKVSNSKY